MSLNLNKHYSILSIRYSLHNITDGMNKKNDSTLLFFCFSIQIFCAPSFDDKILEVVAVFGSMQMAVSRVIKLQHHRIAQVNVALYKM